MLPFDHVNVDPTTVNSIGETVVDVEPTVGTVRTPPDMLNLIIVVKLERSILPATFIVPPSIVIVPPL
jgi:hypothetical protein